MNILQIKISNVTDGNYRSNRDTCEEKANISDFERDLKILFMKCVQTVNTNCVLTEFPEFSPVQLFNLTSESLF